MNEKNNDPGDLDITVVRSTSDIPDNGCTGCIHVTLETNGTVAHYNDECMECKRFYGDMYDNGEEEDA